MSQQQFNQLSGVEFMEKVTSGATAATLGKTEVLVTITENPTQGMSKGISPKTMLTMFICSYDGVPISIVVWNTGIFSSLVCNFFVLNSLNVKYGKN